MLYLIVKYSSMQTLQAVLHLSSNIDLKLLAYVTENEFSQ